MAGRRIARAFGVELCRGLKSLALIARNNRIL